MSNTALNDSGIIRISGILENSVVDGQGIRYVVFTQGCTRNCFNCHNPSTHDINGGKTITVAEIIDDLISNPIITGLTISGGEPFLQAEVLSSLALITKKVGLNIWIYSGYTYEEIMKSNIHYRKLLGLCHVLVDGPYIDSERDERLKFRGSKNQRIIDIQASIRSDKIITLD